MFAGKLKCFSLKNMLLNLLMFLIVGFIFDHVSGTKKKTFVYLIFFSTEV